MSSDSPDKGADDTVYKGFSLRQNLDIAAISLFVAGGGFTVAATLLNTFVETEASNEIQTSLYLTGLGLGGLVVFIKLIDRISHR